MTSQEFEEEFIRVPALQEQDQDIAGPHAICGQAALPGAGGDEYSSKDVYETIWYHSPIGQKERWVPVSHPHPFGSVTNSAFGRIPPFSSRRILQRQFGTKQGSMHGDGAGSGDALTCIA